MPVYEYKCDECGDEREVILSFNEAGKKIDCECGRVMGRKFSPAHFSLKLYPKEKICNALNEEDKHPIAGDSPVRSKRSQDALFRGVDYVRPLEGKVFTGFG